MVPMRLGEAPSEHAGRGLHVIVISKFLDSDLRAAIFGVTVIAALASGKLRPTLCVPSATGIASAIPRINSAKSSNWNGLPWARSCW
jgi:hypothetical protein